MRKAALSVPGLLLSAAMAAQSSPFVDEKTERALLNELSGDLAFETVRVTTQWHKPSGVGRLLRRGPRTSRRGPKPWASRTSDGSTRSRSRLGWTCRRARGTGSSKATGRQARETKAAIQRGRRDLRSPTTRGRPTSRPISSTWARATARPTTRARTCEARSCSPTASRRPSWTRPSGGAGRRASSPGPPRASTRLADSADQVAWFGVPDEDGPNGAKTTSGFLLSARERARRFPTGCRARTTRADLRRRNSRAPRCACTSSSSRPSPKRRRPWSRPGFREPIRHCPRSC